MNIAKKQPIKKPLSHRALCQNTPTAAKIATIDAITPPMTQNRFRILRRHDRERSSYLRCAEPPATPPTNSPAMATA
jgi:hypothetical protein